MTLENLVQINQLKREAPDKRYLVFQCLAHTTELTRVQIRLLSKCHEKRNLDLYQGQFEVDNQLFSELIEIAQALQNIAQRIEF
jgi:hypothetical protein